MKTFASRILLIQLFIIGSFFFVISDSMGQVSEPVLLRLDETIASDRQLLLGKEMALLERNLDDSYYQTTSEGKLYFRFLEKYMDADLEVKVYDWQREELLKLVVPISKQYGENWYVLDGTKIGLDGLELNQYYFVEVLDENKQKTVLRFKYLLDLVPLTLSCEGDNSTSSDTDCNQDVVLTNPELAATINASIVEGVAPFKITWTLIKEDDQRQVIESLLVKEETTSDFSHLYIENLDTWISPYKVEFKVVDACGNEKKCIFCVTSPNDERISSEKKSKFFLFFKIKTDKKDKDKTNPTSPKTKDNKDNVN